MNDTRNDSSPVGETRPDASSGERSTTALATKVAGVIWGAAAGDALGGPVEGLHWRSIADEHGVVDTMLPYRKPPMEHAHLTSEPGSYTDDTRLHLIHCEALISANGWPCAGDLAEAIANWRAAHDDPLERSFIEEYWRQGLYGERKLAFGGHPTNGAIMANHVIGAVHAADPRTAFRIAFELAYITDGYAKESSALHAAAVAAAMSPGATVDDVIDEAFKAAEGFRRDGPLWAETVRTQPWAAFEGRPNHLLVERALEVARSGRGPLAIRADLYPLLEVSPVGSEAGQTFAVALAMLVAANGNYREAVIGAVNYGRDNDSYATVAGAIAGALHGVDAVPETWRAQVRAANPQPDLHVLATRLADVAGRVANEKQRVAAGLEGLVG